MYADTQSARKNMHNDYELTQHLDLPGTPTIYIEHGWSERLEQVRYLGSICGRNRIRRAFLICIT